MTRTLPHRFARIVAYCLLLSATTLTAWSEVLTDRPPQDLKLGDAIRLAMENSPGLRASEWMIQAREADGMQARLLPNPEIGVEVENVAGSAEFSGTDAAEYTVSVSQPIVLGGKRDRQFQVADAERRLAEWTLERTKRDLVRDVTVIFAETLEDQERVVLSKELVQLSGELVETAKRRVKSGGASELEQTKAQIERATSLADQEQMRRRLMASRRRLATLIGMPVAELPPVSGNLYRLHDLPHFEHLKQRLPENPDWARWSAEMELRDAAVALADAQRIPDLDLGIGWRRIEEGDDGAGASAFLLTAGLPLPLFDRNQGARRAATQMRAAASEERLAFELIVERELAVAYSELTRAHAEASAIKETILPAATKAFQISSEGYLQGRFGYLDLLDAQRTLFETRGQYVESLRMYHQAMADIERLTTGDPNVKHLTTEE